MPSSSTCSPASLSSCHPTPRHHPPTTPSYIRCSKIPIECIEYLRDSQICFALCSDIPLARLAFDADPMVVEPSLAVAAPARDPLSCEDGTVFKLGMMPQCPSHYHPRLRKVCFLFVLEKRAVFVFCLGTWLNGSPCVGRVQCSTSFRSHPHTLTGSPTSAIRQVFVKTLTGKTLTVSPASLHDTVAGLKATILVRVRLCSTFSVGL
jgi:hypothetical protein